MYEVEQWKARLKECLQSKGILNAKMEETQKMVKENQEAILTAFLQYVFAVYQDWLPTVGERVILIHIDNLQACETKIEQVESDVIHVQRENEDSYQLSRKPWEQYEKPLFLLPPNNYEAVQEFFLLEWEKSNADLKDSRVENGHDPPTLLYYYFQLVEKYDVNPLFLLSGEDGAGHPEIFLSKKGKSKKKSPS